MLRVKCLTTNNVAGVAYFELSRCLHYAAWCAQAPVLDIHAFRRFRQEVQCAWPQLPIQASADFNQPVVLLEFWTMDAISVGSGHEQSNLDKAGGRKSATE
jgi:hypothetical protein